MNIKNILLFVVGLAIGGTAGVFGTRKYFQDKYQKRYEEDHIALEKYYHRVDEYSRIPHNDKDELESDPVDSSESDSKPGGRMSKEERSEIREKLKKNQKETTNYAAIYKNVDSGDLSESRPEVEVTTSVYPPDAKICAKCCNYDTEECICEITDEEMGYEDGCSDFEPISPVVTAEEQVFDEYQENRNKPPEIISAEACSNLPAYIDHEILYFYTYDEMLVDDNDEPIDEESLLIGDTLIISNFIDANNELMFVINYSLSTCYEIQKKEASWTDSH